MNSTTTKNKVMDYLQMSSEEYDSKIFHTYWNWCHKYSNKIESITQQLIADATLNRWFIIQYAALEMEFLKTVESFPNKLRDAKKEYYHHVTDIFLLYPKPLISTQKANIDFKQEYFFSTDKFIIHAN